MEIFDNIVQIKKNWQPYKVWEIEQQKKENADKILRKKYSSNDKVLKEAKNYGKTIINSIDIMDKHTIDKTEDINLLVKNYSTLIGLTSMALGVGLGAIFKRTNMAKKLPEWKPYWELLGLLVTSAISATGLNIWQAKVLKQTARVARFQTRENDLKDYKNFVVYNDSQQKRAEEIVRNQQLKNLPEEKLFNKESYNFIQKHKESNEVLKNLKKDSGKYEIWKNEYLENEKNRIYRFEEIDKTFSKEDLVNAEREKNVILNAIKKIENKSNEYSTNIEMAAFLFSAIAVGAGTVLGASISSIIQLIKKKNNFSQKVSNRLKLFQFLSLTLLPSIGAMIAVAPTVKLVKDAARIGRFKAKQELLKNPEEFIGITEEERSKINLPAKPELKLNFWQRLKKDFKLVSDFKKDADEYFAYVNTKGRYEEQKQKALKTLNISDNQISEAKKLQQQLFYAFEKVDEKQISFVEDTSAAVDIMQEVVCSFLNFALKILPLYVCAKDVKRINNGKMPETLKDVFKTMTSGKLKLSTVLVLVLPFILPKFIAYLALLKGIQLKQDAGKIGVMSAMKDLDDSRNFVVTNTL